MEKDRGKSINKPSNENITLAVRFQNIPSHRHAKGTEDIAFNELGVDEKFGKCLLCGDVTVDRLKWGNEFLRTRMGAKSNSYVSPETLRRVQRMITDKLYSTSPNKVQKHWSVLLPQRAGVKSSDALPISNGSKPIQKKPRIVNELLRRSVRVRSLVLTGRTREVMKPTVEHVNLTEKEKEKEKEAKETEKVDDLPAVNENEVGVETQAEQVNHRSDVKELSLDEKVNYLVRMVDEFKPKVFGQNKESPSPDFSYKSLYIQTQKKYDDLMEHHYELLRKLEFARGQIAAYEKMHDAMGGAPREVILVSDIGKLAAVANVHQAAQNILPSPSVPVADVAPDAADVAVAEADKNPKKKKTYNKKKKAC